MRPLVDQQHNAVLRQNQVQGYDIGGLLGKQGSVLTRQLRRRSRLMPVMPCLRNTGQKQWLGGGFCSTAAS